MKKGFTLIEMMIVMVIVSLVVVGALAGQGLVKQAKIVNTANQIRSYNIAVVTFQSIYNGLPGDINTAEEFGLDRPMDAIGTSAGEAEITVMCDRTPDYCSRGEVDCDTYPDLCRGSINCRIYPDVCGSNAVDCEATPAYCRHDEVNCTRYPDLCTGEEVSCRTYPDLCEEEEEVRNLALPDNMVSTSGYGNNDRILNYYNQNSSNAGTPGFGGELANFWMMLSNTRLIKETFTQNYNCSPGGAINCETEPGVNLPATQIGNGLIVLSNIGDQHAIMFPTFDYAIGLHFVLGIGDLNPARFENGDISSESSLAANNLTAQEAYGLDTKIDDGKIYKGSVKAIQGYNDNTLLSDNTTGATLAIEECFGSAPVIDSDYNFSATQKVCTLAIKAGF